MRALLLAAGLGTRLRPITDFVPKCLVEVQGKPLLDYWFDNLFEAGVERALVNTHYLSALVESHVSRSPWRDRIDLVHETELLGTGGTILANAEFARDGALMVAHADNLTDFDARRLTAAHAKRPRGAVMTMLAFRTDHPRSCGILECDEEGLVRAFHEKVENPPGDLANGAVYILEPDVLNLLESFRTPVIDFSTEVIPKLMGRILAVPLDCYHRDIGNPEALRKAEIEYRPKLGRS
jgi:mannose-1-phosphate guanylyltransferase